MIPNEYECFRVTLPEVRVLKKQTSSLSCRQSPRITLVCVLSITTVLMHAGIGNVDSTTEAVSGETVLCLFVF